jgi:GNAT superfamily N-acetyltransferase
VDNRFGDQRYQESEMVMEGRQVAITWRIEGRLPTADEHRALAESVGWVHAFAWANLPGSLAASLFGVVAVTGDGVIGMGRLVGDGVMYFYIQDVAVHPDFQRHGVGQAIVEALLAHIRAVAPANAFVGLFATADAMPLYRRNGFTEGDLTGMVQVIPATASSTDRGRRGDRRR